PPLANRARRHVPRGTRRTAVRDTRGNAHRRRRGEWRRGEPQPVLRPRHRRAHAPYSQTAPSGTPRLHERRDLVGDRAERGRVRRARPVRESARGDARPRGHRLLHPRLHDLAQALDGTKHRDRRRRRCDPATRWLGGHHRFARSFGVAPLRDRLLLDAGAFLGARASHPRAALRSDHGGQHIAALVVSLTSALAAIVYAVGVTRLRRRWPLWRTSIFFVGLAALLAALASPIDAYAAVSFAVHMVQHMLLTVVAAPL